MTRRKVYVRNALARRTEAVSTVRAAADDPRAIEGIAVPYGQVATATENGREAFAPGAFGLSVAHWTGRQDGARMAFRAAHGERPIGTVQSLTDSPEGVRFRASIFNTPAGDAYLGEVAAGLNGVSIEFGSGDVPSQRGRDGTVIHRDARLHAIAGSVLPAYDGARISLRDMEGGPMTKCDKCSAEMTPGVAHTCAPAEGAAPAPATAPAAAPATAPAERDAATGTTQMTPAQRSALEAATIAQVAPRGQITISRAEAVYGRHSGHSFLRDLRDAAKGDSGAGERQSRHDAMLTDIAGQMERAGDVLSSEIPGAYPNDYLPGLLTPRILKGRPMGGSLARIPIADARPKIFAKITTSTTVAVQSAENVNPAASDLASTSVTATPLLYGAETIVSRQALDGADPAAEAMILQDMLEAYAQASETVIKTAVEAGATASGTAITAATPYAGVLGNVIAYQTTRFNPAQLMFVPPALYAVLLAQGDTTGRPFLPAIGPVNSDGTARAGATGASVLGADVFLSWASTLNVVVTARPQDYVIFESAVARFSYDAVTGPSGVRLGIWAYLVVGTRLGALKVTAA